MFRKAALWLCITAIMAVAVFPFSVYADTNGSELQITDRPDRLILQLGPRWAGVEFELKTDAGVFPAPVVVDSTGVLKMDLGGSKTYTLSCLASPVPVPGPEEPAETPAPQTPEPAPSAQPETAPGQDAPAGSPEGIPTGILVFFMIGLAAAVGGLIAMRYFKNRRGARYYDDEDDDCE